MHPLFTRPRLLLAYLGAWAALGVVTAFLLVGGELPGAAPASAGPLSVAGAWAPALALAVPLNMAFAVLGLASFYLCRSHPLPRRPPNLRWSNLRQEGSRRGDAESRGTSLFRLVVVHVGGAAATAGAWLAASSAVARGLASWAASGWLPEAARSILAAASLLQGRRASLLFALGILFYLLAAGFHYLLLAFEESRAAAARSMEVRALAREAELAALRGQIDPHFLFNSLNSVAALAGSRGEEAREMALSLASFLRSTLAAGKRQRLSLGEELDLAASYLAIEKARFGDRLGVAVEVDEAARAVPVPPLVLLPLVENAVRHGIAPRVDGGEVAIRGAVEEGRLRLVLENPYDPARPLGVGGSGQGSERGGGLGLENVRRRMRLLYGREGLFNAERREGTFRVRLEIPAEKEREEEA